MLRAAGVRAVCCALKGAFCEGFVEGEIGGAFACVTFLEKGGEEAGEDEELVPGGDLEVEFHAALCGRDDGEEV